MMTHGTTADKRFDPCDVPWPEGAPIVAGEERLRAYRIVRELQSPNSDWPTIRGRLERIDAAVAKAADETSCDRTLLCALIAAESEGDPAADSGSASGLMQITRATWRDMGKRHARFADTDYERDRYDPYINIAMGAAVLAEMTVRIIRETSAPKPPWPLLCMAYNAGPGVVTRYDRKTRAASCDDFPLRALALEHVDEAIKETKTHIYYTVCNGARVNPYIEGETVTPDADRFAVMLKTAEVYYFLDRIDRFGAALSNTV